MSEFGPGDRVQDVCWDGRYAGTVRRIDGESVWVKFDGVFEQQQMSPNQIVKLATVEAGE